MTTDNTNEQGPWGARTDSLDLHNAPAATQTPPPSETLKVTFPSLKGWLFGLAFKGTLLMLVTFGIYRFWFITDLRRKFWNRTEIGGSPLEYTGRAMELFIGFLIALAIVLPLYFAIAAGAFLEQPLAFYVQVAGFIGFNLLYPFAIYRMRKYRVGRTVWRGVRFYQDQGGYAYTGRAILWGLFAIITLGIAIPWMLADLERYRINNTYFGNQQLSSNANARSILKPFFVIYGIALILALPTLIKLPTLLSDPDTFITTGQPGQYNIGKDAQAPFLLLFSSMFVVTFMMPYFYARRLVAFTNEIRCTGAKLKSTLRAKDLYFVYFLYFLVLLVATLLFAGMFFMLISSLTIALGAHAGVIFSFIVSYVTFFLTFSIVYMVLLVGPMWQNIANSLTLENAAGLEAILQSSADRGSGINEGIGDALDMGGGFDVGL